MSSLENYSWTFNSSNNQSCNYGLKRRSWGRSKDWFFNCAFSNTQGHHTVRILKISPSTPIPLIGYRTCMTTSVCQRIKDETWKKDCACTLQTRSICWIVNLYGRKSKRQSWLLMVSFFMVQNRSKCNWLNLMRFFFKSCCVQQDIVKYSNSKVGWN